MKAKAVRLFQATILSAIALGAVAFLAPAPALAWPPAWSDNGDGSTVCNVGEICFASNDYSWEKERKHFWWGANHSANTENLSYRHPDYLWCYVSSSGTCIYNFRVRDDADMFKNRDTECTVWVWDIDCCGNWFTYAQQGWGSTFYKSISPRNNGHSRCGGSADFNPKLL